MGNEMKHTPLTDAVFDEGKVTLMEHARRMERDRARLIEALRPFALSACYDDGVLDSHLIEDCTELTEAHLRKAAAALKSCGEE